MAGELTEQQLQQVNARLGQDPTYQRLNARYQLTKSPLDHAALSNYVLNHPNSAGHQSGLRDQSDTYQRSVGGAGTLEQKNADPWWNPSKAAMLLGIAGGGYLAAPYLGGAAGGAGSGSGAGASVTAGSEFALPGELGIGGGMTGGGAAGVGGAAAGVGEGVRDGLLGPSAETQYDANHAFADNGGGWQDWAKKNLGQPGAAGNIAKALYALGAAGIGKALTGNGSDNVPPEITSMLKLSSDRANYQNPLFQAATQGTYQMLPTFARQGTTMPTGPLPDRRVP